MRTLILLFICAVATVAAAFDAIRQGKEHHHVVRHAIVGFGVGLLFCWFLVRVVGIFDNWGRY
jgi:hypothetical protein